MNKMMTLSIAALTSAATLGLALPAAAKTGHHDRAGYSTRYAGYDRHDHRSDRRYYNNRNDRRDYRHQCDNGTGGTVIGAIAGGLAGNELAGRGDKTVGTIIGGALGALAGRAIDKGNDGCR